MPIRFHTELPSAPYNTAMLDAHFLSGQLFFLSQPTYLLTYTRPAYTGCVVSYYSNEQPWWPVVRAVPSRCTENVWSQRRTRIASVNVVSALSLVFDLGAAAAVRSMSSASNDDLHALWSFPTPPVSNFPSPPLGVA